MNFIGEKGYLFPVAFLDIDFCSSVDGQAVSFDWKDHFGSKFIKSVLVSWYQIDVCWNYVLKGYEIFDGHKLFDEEYEFLLCLTLIYQFFGIFREEYAKTSDIDDYVVLLLLWYFTAQSFLYFLGKVGFMFNGPFKSFNCLFFNLQNQFITLRTLFHILIQYFWH